MAGTSTALARETSSALFAATPDLGKMDQTWFLDLILLRGREVNRTKISRAERGDEEPTA
jgi:hypothetical protein